MRLCKQTMLSLLTLIISFFGANVMADTQPLPKPKVIIFDVNETLLDLENMRESVGKALAGQQQLLPL